MPSAGLSRFPAGSTKAEEIADCIRCEGGCVVEGLFDPNIIRQMRDAVIAKLDSDTDGTAKPGSATQGMAHKKSMFQLMEDFVGKNTVRFSSLGKMCPSAYFEMLDNALYREVADLMLLPSCGTYWVNTGQAMLIGPGNPAQPLHRDAGNWPQVYENLWPKCPEITVSAMIALEEVTDEMGATRMIPGSQSWENVKDLGSQDQSYPAEMKPGDAFIYSGFVLHGGGENKTKDRWRMAMHLSYVVGWLTPEESNPLDYTTEELAEQSPHVQQVLGHRSYDPLKIRKKKGAPGGGAGLWLRHVRKIEDFDYSGGQMTLKDDYVPGKGRVTTNATSKL